MTRRLPQARIQRHALAVSLSLGVLAALPANARDDTPAELLGAVNPVALDEVRAAYFARQFKANCARCHGAAGDGGGDDAAAQAVAPTRFTDARAMSARTDGQLFWQIARGGAPRCDMPAFGRGSEKSWDDEKIWGMVAFLRRLAKSEPASPPAP